MASPLLELPAELRDMIYELVLGETKAIRIARTSIVIEHEGLFTVCRHIRQEATDVYLSKTLTSADTITFYANDFDFSVLIACLNSLTVTQLQTVHARRSLRIRCTQSMKPDTEHMADLIRWLRYCTNKPTGPATVFAGACYEFVGAICGPDQAWDDGIAAMLAGLQDRSSYRAYQAALLAKPEWANIRWAWQGASTRSAARKAKAKWDALTDEDRAEIQLCQARACELQLEVNERQRTLMLVRRAFSMTATEEGDHRA